MNLITVALSLFLVHYVLSLEDPKCYYPSGDEARQTYYQACESKETSFKTCCPGVWTCLKNGLCESPTGPVKPVASIARGACTNQDWSRCPSICPLGNCCVRKSPLSCKLTVLLEKSNTTVFVAKCDDGKYCCHARQGYDCCSGGDWRFSIKEPGPPVAAIAGGTVGGVVGVAILLGLGWWFWKKKRAARNKADESAVVEKSSQGSHIAHPSVAEADAGPESVLVESDARTTQPNRLHELAA